MNHLPLIVFEKYISLFFRQIYFQIVIEDRRPDLDIETQFEEVKKLGYKYKTQFRFKFFGFQRSIQMRSIYPPSYFRNGKELEYTKRY